MQWSHPNILVIILTILFIYLTIYLTILTNLTIKLSIIYLNYCVQYFQFYNIGLYDFSSVRNCSALIKL